MQYRINRRTGDRISEIGLGSAYLCDADMDEAVRALRAAYDGGINYFDLGAGNGKAFSMWREALGDVRKNVLYQVHFGADYSKGEYGWTLELETIKRSVDWMLKELGTDTIDYGMIHCQDEFSDWETYQKNGVYDFLRRMKERGVVRHIGLSSHTPAVIERILNEAPVDMLLFSINPAYDYGQGEFANGGVDERAAIYRRCERDGVGISVMKPFSGGQLLDAAQSPFKRALTPYQCLRYALGQARRADGAARRAIRQGSGDAAGLPRAAGGGAGLQRHRRLRARRGGRQVRVLQPLPALPDGPGHRLDQQVL